MQGETSFEGVTCPEVRQAALSKLRASMHARADVPRASTCGQFEHKVQPDYASMF